MSAVIAAPDPIAAAATDLAGIGSAVGAAQRAAATNTQAVLPAAADEISAGIGQLFSQYGRQYQAVAAQAATLHDQFVRHLATAGESYAGAEAANASLLGPLSAAADPISGLPIYDLLTAVTGYVSAALEPFPLLNALAQSAMLVVLIPPVALFAVLYLGAQALGYT